MSSGGPPERNPANTQAQYTHTPHTVYVLRGSEWGMKGRKRNLETDLTIDGNLLRIDLVQDVALSK